MFEHLPHKSISNSSSGWADKSSDHVGQEAAQPELLPHQHEELEGSSGWAAYHQCFEIHLWINNKNKHELQPIEYFNTRWAQLHRKVGTKWGTCKPDGTDMMSTQVSLEFTFWINNKYKNALQTIEDFNTRCAQLHRKVGNNWGTLKPYGTVMLSTQVSNQDCQQVKQRTHTNLVA